MSKNQYVGGAVQQEKGFTLIELSVVLAIIGLLVAGIVAGQNLVKQAKLRNIVREQDEVRQSLNAFKLRYDALPGDFDNAYSFWGANCASTADRCNGDKDRQIEITGTDINDGMEIYRFWQHLNLAQVYNGAFTGQGGGTDGDAGAIQGTIGVNIPASKMQGIGITPIYTTGTTYTTATYSGNVLIFGGEVEDELATLGKFSATDAYNIDIKADDGAPLTGVALSAGTTGADADNCVDNTNDTYNLDSTEAEPCGLAFKL